MFIICNLNYNYKKSQLEMKDILFSLSCTVILFICIIIGNAGHAYLVMGNYLDILVRVECIVVTVHFLLTCTVSKTQVRKNGNGNVITLNCTQYYS